MLTMHIIDTVIILAHDQNICFKYMHVLNFQQKKTKKKNINIKREMTRCIQVVIG